MSKKITKTERDEQIERLRQWFPRGSTVYTILRHVSSSGMSRTIGVVSIRPGDAVEINIRHPNYAVSVVCGYAPDQKREGVKVHGCGMDMGFDVAYSIARTIYGDGYALNHKWL
jgi:hypothetical protein